MKIKGMAASLDDPSLLIPVEIEITDPKIIAMIKKGMTNNYSIEKGEVIMCGCAADHPGIACGAKGCNCHPEETRDDSDGGIERALSSLLNSYCSESVSGTPDFILAKYMLDCLKSFNEAVTRRALWRGEDVELPSLQKLHFEGEN